jgi:hypothetical protein
VRLGQRRECRHQQPVLLGTGDNLVGRRKGLRPRRAALTTVSSCALAGEPGREVAGDADEPGARGGSLPRSTIERGYAGLLYEVIGVLCLTHKVESEPSQPFRVIRESRRVDGRGRGADAILHP